MAVSLTLKQTSSIVDGTTYRVKHEITAAAGISSAVFVFKTVTQEFDHFARVADMSEYPDTYEVALADGKTFYRLDTVQRDHSTATLAELDLTIARERMKLLAVDMQSVQDDFLAVTTTVITGD